MRRSPRGSTIARSRRGVRNPGDTAAVKLGSGPKGSGFGAALGVGWVAAALRLGSVLSSTRPPIWVKREHRLDVHPSATQIGAILPALSGSAATARASTAAKVTGYTMRDFRARHSGTVGELLSGAVDASESDA